MEADVYHTLEGTKKAQWVQFLNRMGLEADEGVETTVLIWEDGEIAATGSRQGNVLKCIAVDPMYQGEGLTATLLTHLRQDAFADNLRHLFLYTKPKNKTMFSSLFFYPVAETDKVLLMENEKDGVQNFVNSLEAPCTQGTIGAAVMHCNPFTRGHRWLVETAARECDWLYIFVLSEDRGLFSAEDRLELVRKGTADLPNVTVCPTGPYLISSATFPTYFIKDKTHVEDIECLLDIAVFTGHYAPHFGITRRYVGTEPLCPVTSRYNEALAANLPGTGVELRLLTRLESESEPISASRVRALLHQNQPDQLRKLVPDSTFAYLEEHHLI